MLNRRRFLMSTAAGIAGLHFTPACAQDATPISIFVAAAPGVRWDHTLSTTGPVWRADQVR